AVLAWSNTRWSPSFRADQGAQAHLQTWRSRFALATLAGAVLLAVLSHVAFLAAPRETFGAAGWLWLGAIASMIAAAALRPVGHSRENDSEGEGPPARAGGGGAMGWCIVVPAAGLRVGGLEDVAF